MVQVSWPHSLRTRRYVHKYERENALKELLLVLSTEKGEIPHFQVGVESLCISKVLQLVDFLLCECPELTLQAAIEQRSSSLT